MTRTAQWNVISDVSTIKVVDVCPLDKSRSVIKSIAVFASSWFTKVPAYPIVESSVRSFVSFPPVVIDTVMVGFLVVFSSIKSGFFPTLFKFLVSCFRITLSTTESFFGYVRGRVILLFLALSAWYCWHVSIVRNYLAISKQQI